jgi:hypothetical protein
MSVSIPTSSGQPDRRGFDQEVAECRRKRGPVSAIYRGAAANCAPSAHPFRASQMFPPTSGAILQLKI